MTQPRLLVFEGVDGAGKTTLSRLLTEQLVAQGRQVREFSFPGSTPGTLGALVYRFHHDSAALGVKQVHPAALQLMHVAAHVDTIIRAIGPTLDEGLDVTLDLCLSTRSGPLCSSNLAHPKLLINKDEL